MGDYEVPAAKKVHEYEAIWLSGTESGGGVGDQQNKDNCLGVVAGKDSVFTQKSNEIRLLLNELRSHPSDDARQPSPSTVKSSPPLLAISRSEKPTSPRLHPDRVLSELQALVERANRNKDDLMKVSPDRPQSRDISPSSPSPLQKSSSCNVVHPAGSLSAKFVTTMSVHNSSALNPPNASNPSNPVSGRMSPQFTVKIADANGKGPSESSGSGTPSASSQLKKETKAPAFRPPPPYPTNLYVKLAPLSKGSSPPPQQRRVPPEYKAPPPPMTRTATPKPQTSLQQPVAPPRSKKHVSVTGAPAGTSTFSKGPPIPVRSFLATPDPMSSDQQPPADQGIDVDAVAAIMAATENTSSPKARLPVEGSSSPTAAANKALSKALGKFHATAASFKTKLAQLGDVKDGATDPPAVSPMKQVERESNFLKPTVGNFNLSKIVRVNIFIFSNYDSFSVYVGDGVGVVNTSETTTSVRKKQQYL